MHVMFIDLLYIGLIMAALFTGAVVVGKAKHGIHTQYHPRVKTIDRTPYPYGYDED
jgi:hypothetical protein